MSLRDPRSGVLRALLMGIGLLPFVPWALRGIPGLSLISDAAQVWFGFQCQRDPARALHFFGRALPVCARCSGVYFGLGLGALLVRPRLSSRQLASWVGAASVVMLLDVLSEALGLRSAWAPLRVLTGFGLAYPVAVALVTAARARWPARGALESATR